jgi:glycosyltransferase involved in cell wall biosynthesis
MAGKRILILHDFDGRLYFQAIVRLCAMRSGDLEFRELTVSRLLLAKAKRRRLDGAAIRTFFRNLGFRVAVPFVSGRTIVLGIAPFNLRLVWYALLARRNRIVYHTSWHDWTQRGAPWQYGFLTTLLSGYWKRFLTGTRGLTIVCVTPQVEASLRAFLQTDAGVESPRIVTIPHSVDVEMFAAAAPAALGATARLLFVGRLVPEKGLHVLFDVARTLGARVSITIVGDGPLEAQVRQQCGELPNVRFVGAIRQKDKLSALYREHDVLVVPSIRRAGWEELFGLVVIEAMASGLIVVASDHIGPRTVITSGVDGYLVPEDDPAAIIGVLERVAGDPQHAMGMKRAARSKAVRTYSLESVGANWDAVLSDSLPGHTDEAAVH